MQERMSAEYYGGEKKVPKKFLKPGTLTFLPGNRLLGESAREDEKSEKSAREIIEEMNGLEDDLLVLRLHSYNELGESDTGLDDLFKRLALERKLINGKVSNREKIRDRKDGSDTPSPGETPEDQIKRRVVRNEAYVVHLGEEDIPAVFKPRDGEPVVIDERGRERGVCDKKPQQQYLRAWLAGFISKAMDSDVVPVTVIREINGQLGSVQEFAIGKDAGSEEWRKANGEDLQLIAAMDYIWQIPDRHNGNFRVNLKDNYARAIDNDLIFPTIGRVNILSLPLRFVSEKEILPAVAKKLKKLTDPARVKILKKAFEFVLGEENNHVFDVFQERLNSLVEAKKGVRRFPVYRLPDLEAEQFFKGQQEEWNDLQETPLISKTK